MTKYVEEIVNDIVRVSGHSFDSVLDEIVSCGYLYVCNDEYNDIPVWLATAVYKLEHETYFDR
jgi:hypothetical protein